MRTLRLLLMSVCVIVAMPSDAHAHIRLASSSPAANDSIATSPVELRLNFAAHIEAGYTSLNLVAPNGQIVATGPIAFVTGSDREFTVAVPTLTLPGSYTVRWRTAGADGHVLEGSYTFVLIADTTAPLPATAVTPVFTPAADEHNHGGAAQNVTGAPDVAARWLHFTSLLMLLGALCARLLLLPRLDLPSNTREAAVRALWRSAAFAAVVLIVAAIGRLWLQSIALHGADRALSTALLTMMLRDTSWGRTWLVQAVCFAVLGMGIVWARPHRDTAALIVAVPAALALSTIPGLTGHAAGTGFLTVLNDAVHVVAGGAWLGTLAVLTIAALPAVIRAQPVGRITADAIAAFSPIALVAAAFVVTSGLINALQHFENIAQLTGTSYGRALLVKIALVGCVVIAGFINWRVITPRLAGDFNDARRVRVSIGAEITFAALVLLATAYLTGVQRP